VKIVIRKCDLKKETFRAGGKGGQHQNKTESAVRYTHIPTGIKAESRTERCQHSNGRTALALLLAKLHRHYTQLQEAQDRRDYEAKPQAAFGSQIRTYWLCGHQRVVDHRTGKSASPAPVLNGGFECLTRS
jgi:peptide chain release factor 2